MTARSSAIVLAVGVLFALLAQAAPAAAQGNEAEGKRRFKAGQDLYKAGRFLDAAREFEAGYAVAPRPQFLLNIGHSYRRAQEWHKAKEAYQKLLQTTPNYDRRGEVEAHIKSIDDAIQAADPEPAPRPVTPPPAPRPTPPPASTAVASDPPPAPNLTPAPPPEPETRPTLVEREVTDGGDRASADSIFRKTWFWVVVGAVVAGGVAAAVIATRPGSGCNATSCFSETGGQ